MSDYHLPIEQYMLTPLQSAERAWISQVIIRRCLGRFDFDYPDAGARPTATSAALTTYSVLARRYGVTDLASVRRWGYHEPRNDPETGKGTKAVLLADLSPAEQKVLTGFDPTAKGPATSYKGQKIPPNGCRAEPDRQLSGVAHGTPQSVAGKTSAVNVVDGLIVKLKAESYEQSMADPRVVAAFKTWSSCMKAAGYHETNPMLAPARFFASAAPGRVEISTAQADVSCKDRTNLVGLWFAVESEYQNAAIGQHAKQLTSVKTALQQEVANLESLLRNQSNG